jgi:hypothetical protein
MMPVQEQLGNCRSSYLSEKGIHLSINHAAPRQALPSTGEMQSGDHGLFVLHRIEQLHGPSRGRNVDINTL